MAKEKTAREGPANSVALVGEETLLGRELKEVLEARAAEINIEAFGASGEGNFSEREGETIYVRPLDAAAIQSAYAILVAGSEEGAAKTYEIVKQNGGTPLVVDCTGHLESRAEARLIAPILEHPDWTNPAWRSHWLFVVAHPAAAAIAIVMERVRKYRPIRAAVVHVFEPASERGKRGLSELHQQTTSLLNFKSLEKNVFDAQLAFNLLASYGEEAPTPLKKIEARIEQDTASLLGRKGNAATVPQPSIRVVQAPVFHGYSLSFWMELEGEVQAGEVEEALASAQIEVRRQNEEPPNNAGAASQSGLLAGNIRADSNNSRAVWLWIAADNLRLTADAALEFLQEIRGRRQ